MKKVRFFLSALLLAFLYHIPVNAQNPLWNFPGSGVGQSAGITYNFNNPQQLHSINFFDPYEKNQNAMVGPDGKLAFYIIDNDVFLRSGHSIGSIYANVQQNNTISTYEAKGYAEITIVPDPANCNRFYLFSAAENNHSDYIPCCAILDYNPDSSESSILSDPGTSFYNLMPNQQDLFDPYESDIQRPAYFAASDITPNNERFVYFSDGALIVKMKLSANGLEYVDHLSPNTLSRTYANADIRGEMELIKKSDGGYRLALPVVSTFFNPSMARNSIFTIDLDANGDFIGNSQKLIPTFDPASSDNYFVHGLEFTPDGDYLYVTCHSKTTSGLAPVYYIDLNQTTPVLIALSGVPQNPDLSYSQIELNGKGKSAKMYFGTSGGMISYSNPSAPGTGIWNQNVTNFSYPLTDLFANNNTSGTSYILPDQIDGMDYQAFYLATEECCIQNSVYSAQYDTISGNVIWDPNSNPFGATTSSPITIRNKLVIPEGASLTIKDLTIEFAPHASLEVYPGTGTGIGGRLILDDAILTVNQGCSSTKMWQGVVLYGRPSEGQKGLSNSVQSWMTMKGKSRIEHAKTGVAVGTSAADAGGVIQTTGGTFRNNQYDVWIYPYQNNEPGSPNLNTQNKFVSTKFVTDGLLLDWQGIPVVHVTMESVKGVTFTGCTFINEALNVYTDPMMRGRGIDAVESSFTVNTFCTGVAQAGYPCPGNNTVFENLCEGILVYSNTSGLASVLECVFNNVVRGFHGTGSCNPKLIGNEFYVFADQTITSSGIYLYSVPSYVIQENVFAEFGNNGNSYGGESYGVVINDCGEQTNYVYRNTFRNLKVGGQSQGNNGSASDFVIPPVNPVNPPALPISGLTWLCNTFDDQIYEADLAVASGRINYHQGTQSVPADPKYHRKMAGNLFSSSTYTPTNNYYASPYPVSEPFIYVYHTPSTVYPTEPVLRTYPEIALVAGADPYDPSKACPVLAYGNVSLNPIGQLIGKAPLLQGINAIFDLIDGGNMFGRYQEVQNALPEDIASLLLPDAPYSSEILLAALINSDAPAEDKLEVLAQNSPLTKRIYALAEEHIGVEAVEESIGALQEGISPYENLLGDVWLQNMDLTALNQNAENWYLENGYAYETVRELYADEYDLYSVLKKIDFSLAVNDEYTVWNELDQLMLNGANPEIYEYFELVVPFLLSDTKDQFLSEHPGFFDDLHLFAESESVVAARAQSILVHFSEHSMIYDIEPLIYSSSKNSVLTTGSSPKSQLQELILYPNPTNGVFTVKGMEGKSYTISVFDLTGRIVRSETLIDNIIDISGLNEGSYLIRFVSANSSEEITLPIIKH